MKLISLKPQTLRVKAKQGTGKEGQLSGVGAGQLPTKEGSSHRILVTGTEGRLSWNAVHTNSTGRLTQTFLPREHLKFLSSFFENFNFTCMKFIE